MEFENKINAVLKNSCCTKETLFLAAVSGGADSAAMLCVLYEIIPQERLFCLHVDHNLRKDSVLDAEFVRDFCGRRGISFILKTIAPGKIESFSRRRGTGIEAAARHFRRRALLKEASRLGDNALILTAHTKDDALELSLMRILRGAGPSGLSAMPARKGKFIRPLLSISHAEVISYLNEKKIQWREDSSNTDEKFLRNKIRRRLVPLLNDSFPLWDRGLSAMAETQSLVSGFINDEASSRVEWEREAGKRVFFTNAENFFFQPQIIKEEALFQGINRYLESFRKNYHSVSIRRSLIRRFCDGSVNTADLAVVTSQRKKRRLLRIKSDGKKIKLYFANNHSCETGFSLLINKPGLYNLNSINVNVSDSSVKEDSNCGFNAFFAGLPLVLRGSFNDDFLVNKEKKIMRREAEGNPVSAVDVHGTAAFISKKTGKVLFARDFIPETVYSVKLFIEGDWKNV